MSSGAHHRPWWSHVYRDHNGQDKARNAFRVATSAAVQQTKEAALARLTV